MVFDDNNVEYIRAKLVRGGCLSGERISCVYWRNNGFVRKIGTEAATLNFVFGRLWRWWNMFAIKRY